MQPQKFVIKKAEKKQAYLRLGIEGPTGSGKTYTALKVASYLNLGRIVVIDTQGGQSQNYGHLFDFDFVSIEDYHPQNFIDCFKQCVAAGYMVIIIDSVSHEWEGCLELKEQESKKNSNQYTAWAPVTAIHNRFYRTLTTAPVHIIGCIRQTMDHVQETDDNGKKQVKQLGMGPQVRKGDEYNWDITLTMRIEGHVGVVTKSRDGEGASFRLDQQAFEKPGHEFVGQLSAWMNEGAPQMGRAIALLKMEMREKWALARQPIEDFEPYFEKHYGGKTIEEIHETLAQREREAAERKQKMLTPAKAEGAE